MAEGSGGSWAERRVFDFNHVPIGKIVGIKTDPKTKAVSSIRVSIESPRDFDGRLEEIDIPVRKISSITREAVTVDLSLKELSRNPVIARNL